MNMCSVWTCEERRVHKEHFDNVSQCWFYSLWLSASGWSHAPNGCYQADRAGFVQFYDTKVNFVAVKSN